MVLSKDVKDFPVHFKDGSKFGDGVNSGIDYYPKANLSMDKFTEFLDRVDHDHPSAHFIEQVGFAYCLKNLELLPYNRYSTKGGIKEETRLLLKVFLSSALPLPKTSPTQIKVGSMSLASWGISITS